MRCQARWYGLVGYTRVYVECGDAFQSRYHLVRMSVVPAPAATVRPDLSLHLWLHGHNDNEFAPITPMHLMTLAVFACLFWYADDPGRWRVVADQDVVWTTSIVVGQPILVGILGWIVSTYIYRRHRKIIDAPQGCHTRHQRYMAGIRLLGTAIFMASVLCTNWPVWLSLGSVRPEWQIFGDLVVVLPFFMSMIALWTVAYPVERALMQEYGEDEIEGRSQQGMAWRLSAYLDFQLRHYMFAVAIPMLMILFVANLTIGYEKALTEITGWSWTDEMLLGLSAGLVFIISPILLRYIWRTRSLEHGPLRDRLEAISRRIGFRCRDILVWKSDGMMINAAVMGLLPRVRYVILSDALLSTMDHEQVEAVFGHEVGHVKLLHMQFFLLFAFVGWLLVAGVMEGVALWVVTTVIAQSDALMTVEGVGVVCTIIVWGIGFGWISRRFERQADISGAHSVTPDFAECQLPCSVHLPAGQDAVSNACVCMTGAKVFASALERVASLNGIPLEEWSWRHASIGKRIRFLLGIAGDPSQALRFNQTIHRIKLTLIILALAGSGITVYYWVTVAEPAILKLQGG